MSLKNKIMLLSLFLIPVGIFFAMQRQPSAQESFSSRYPLDTESHSSDDFFAKPNRMISTTIEVVGDLPETPEGELHLRATFTLEKDFQGPVSYQWIIPDGIEVVSGQIQEDINSISTEEPQTAEIILTNIEQKEVEQLIHFEVSIISNGVKIGSSAVYSTSPPSRENPPEDTPSKKGVHF